MLNGSKKHRVVGSFTTNTSVPGHESWDLTPYKKSGMGKPGGSWRLIEVGCNNEKNSGTISADGTLIGLQDAFEDSLSYDGYMELQISDPEPKCKECPCPEE